MTKRATTLADAYRACAPDQPLQSDSPWYLDLSPGRGDDVVSVLRKRFDLYQPPSNDDDDHDPSRYVRVAFLSHRGAGKTTELHRLSSATRQRFHRIYLAANKELDEQDIEIEDLLFALAVAVERDANERNAPIPPRVADKVGAWFSDVIQTTEWATKSGVSLDPSKGAVSLFKLLSSQVAPVFKHTVEHRTELRAALRRQPKALVEAVNQLLDAANASLQKKGRELVVVIDNLDRYPPAVANKLLVERGAMLRDLRTHFVITPPIALHYKPVSEPLRSYYDVELMNTVRIRGKDDPYNEPSGAGADILLQALRLRFDVDALIPNTDAQQRIITASGGAMRELLHIIQQAILRTEGDLHTPATTLTLAAIDKAVAAIRTEYRDRINVNEWMPTLAHIARTKQLPGHQESMDVLFQRLALKYNGQGWYDVHPLVAELDEFTAAMAAAPTGS